MKRKSLLISLILTVALVLGTFQAAFAGYGIDGTAGPDADEYVIEKAAFKAIEDAKTGKYELVSTDEVAGWLNEGYLIIDTMPAGSFSKQHVPGAINVTCGDNVDDSRMWDDSQGEALVAAAHKKYGTTPVKYYWSSYSKSWIRKQPKAKYWTKCTRKGDKGYGKKTKIVNKWVKDKPIIVYCGFVKCRRSHYAAQYLVKQGYTKVYRYLGGISAWGDSPDGLPNGAQQ